MVKLPETPHIPEQLLPYWDEHAERAHEQLRRQAYVNEFMAKVPEIAYGPADTSRYVDLWPRGKNQDTETTDVLLLPFANGWSPAMAVRAIMQQRSFAEQRRMIVLPGNTLRDSAYKLGGAEHAEVRRGYLDPVAERRVRLLESLRIKRINILGASLGASEGAAIAKLAPNRAIEVKYAALSEPANMIDVTKWQKIAAFLAGASGFNKAVNDAAIPILSAAQKSRDIFDKPLQLVQQTNFIVGAVGRKTNRDAISGMTHDRFLHDVVRATHAFPEAVFSVFAAADSKISDVEVVASLEDEPLKGILAEVIKGYGHEMNDNVVVNALLGKKAVESVITV